MSDTIINLPVVNQQAVADAIEKILDVTEGVPNDVVLAALAEMVGVVATCINEKNPDPVIDWLRHRAWEVAHETYSRRMTPRPNNVTPFTPPESTQ